MPRGRAASVDVVGDRVRVQPRFAMPAGVLGGGRLPRAHVEQAHLHADAGVRYSAPCRDDAVGVQLEPAVERHVGYRGGRGIESYVSRGNQRELAFEVRSSQRTAPTCARPSRHPRASVARGQRDEVGHGEARRRAGLAADRQLDLARLLGREPGPERWAAGCASSDGQKRNPALEARNMDGGTCMFIAAYR